MPELPEVETIVRALRTGGRGGPPILGRRILDAQLLWKRTLATPPWAAARSQLLGQPISGISRRGKFIRMDLPQRGLLFHLRMSGDLHVNSDDEKNPHDRFVLYLEPDLRLAFTDPRKFGRIWLVSDPELFLSVLGPEPLTSDFTPDGLYQGLKSRKRRIKPLLMDQTFLAGLGNIYTDEALFLAGIHPLTPANLVTKSQAYRLWEAIRTVLSEAIEQNGASIDWMYRGGDFQSNFRVYQRNGESCLKCGTAIIRLRVNQRGTHICPQCQPALA